MREVRDGSENATGIVLCLIHLTAPIIHPHKREKDYDAPKYVSCFCIQTNGGYLEYPTKREQ